MAKNTRDRSLGNGVYFAQQDYVGIRRRIMILVIDFCVFSGILGILFAVREADLEHTDSTTLKIALVLSWLYAVLLKRSRIRTVGYRTMGAKLVNLKGETPSIFMLTLRELLWVLGPINLFLDLIWCSIDEDKQSLRDRISQINVVRKSAQPIGSGEIHLTYHNALGYSFTYPAVTKPKAKQS